MFATEADFYAACQPWYAVLADLPEDQVIRWLTGDALLPEASEQATDAVERLLAACPPSILAGVPDEGRERPIRSAYRSYDRQAAIWGSKFRFTLEGGFGPITAEARQAVGDLLRPDESNWDTDDPRHWTAWAELSAEARQWEILQTSAAPGTSRHHWGTEFDLFDPDLEPINWLPGGSCWPVYQWLCDHAPRYGFYQPYSAGRQGGYIEERWHWSYYPIARPALDYLRDRQAAFATALEWLWTRGVASAAQFSYIRQVWPEYVFGVREQPEFLDPMRPE